MMSKLRISIRFEGISYATTIRFVSPKDFKHGTTKDGVKSFDGTGPFKMGEHKKIYLQNLIK